MLNIGPQKEKRHFVQYYVRSLAKVIEIGAQKGILNKLFFLKEISVYYF